MAANPCVIKEPDVEANDSNYNYIKDYVSLADSILFSDNFTDPNEGWQKYLDMSTFVDWYLINEIMKNRDGMFYSSCYMSLKRGGKLKMGPVWDFDLSSGNDNKNSSLDELYVKKALWYSRLYEDPAFVEKLKERFMFFYNNRDAVFLEINLDAQHLNRSVQENDNKWGTFYKAAYNDYDIWGSYLNEVESLKEWLSNRFDWLKSKFDK